MSLVSDILRSYRAPSAVITGRLPRATEASALATLMAGCFLIFVAQWPRLAREASIDPTTPLEARLGGALLGIMFILPLVAYVVAAAIWLFMKAFAMAPSGLAVRTAFFWSLLAGAPIWLAHGFFSGFLGSGPARDGAELVILAVYLWILTGSIMGSRKPEAAA